MRDVFWHIVLYFVYFSTLVIWIRLIGAVGVRAQGNRGVIINNTKFDGLNGVQYIQKQQINTTILPTITFLNTSEVIVFFSIENRFHIDLFNLDLFVLLT